MSIYHDHAETPGKRAVPIVRCIITVLDLANILLLGITLGLYYAWMPRQTEDYRIPINWTDPLVIVATLTSLLWCLFALTRPLLSKPDFHPGIHVTFDFLTFLFLLISAIVSFLHSPLPAQLKFPDHLTPCNPSATSSTTRPSSAASSSIPTPKSSSFNDDNVAAAWSRLSARATNPTNTNNTQWQYCHPSHPNVPALQWTQLAGYILATIIAVAHFGCFVRACIVTRRYRRENKEMMNGFWEEVGSESEGKGRSSKEGFLGVRLGGRFGGKFMGRKRGSEHF